MMRYCAWLLLLSLTACTSQPTTTTEYLLRSDLEQRSRQLSPSADFAFGTLVVADYIDHPGLVLETSRGEVHRARNHQWAEPLRRSLKLYLATEVSQHAGEDILFEVDSPAPTTIDIRIDQLHGSSDGEAVLVAFWRLVTDGNDDRAYQFAETLPLQRDGYDALAEAEKSLLSQLAQQIAQSLDPAGQ